MSAPVAAAARPHRGARATARRGRSADWALAIATIGLAWTSAAASEAGAAHFVEAAAEAGLDFVHVNGMAGERWLAEIVGAGVAVLDFDGDGRLDVWLVQGGPLADRSGADLPGDRLFRNTSTRRKLAFEDATGAAGVRAPGYGMGIATGDIDNDGDADVLLANFGPNQLFENLGDGRFRDITRAAGIAGDAWSVSASFADVDADGDADLYIGNYLDFTLANHKICRDLAARLGYCAPTSYHPVSDRLYRNQGGGRFEDATQAAGVGGALGAALGVVAEDFDADGDTDIYVANDGSANLLWQNQGGGRFVDDALLAGAALNGNGAAEAGMGVAAEDFDGDCDPDIFLTHLATETNTLYVNHGGWFEDASNPSGLAAGSGPYTGFGTGWFDADNDGDLDLFSANGAVTALPEQRDAGVMYPLRQRNQLWLNDGAGRYAETPGGPAFDLVEVSRGAAFADLDNDGDTDILVTNSNGPVRLYRNDAPQRPWLGVALEAPPGRAVLGAVVWREMTPGQTPAGNCQRRRVATDGSYASASDPRALFGLGPDRGPQHVRVRWPDGTEERFGPLPPGRYHKLRQGAGRRTGKP